MSGGGGDPIYMYFNNKITVFFLQKSAGDIGSDFTPNIPHKFMTKKHAISVDTGSALSGLSV